jgi:7-cyano-7-deazaguanine reductase
MSGPETSPLGREVPYPEHYDPTLLFPIPRAEGRARLGLRAPLPFAGVDVWNAYELSWLGPRGKPEAALAVVTVPCESPAIVESKSFKLYLGSFGQTRLAGADAVRDAIVRDVSAACGAPVAVRLSPVDRALTAEPMAGEPLDVLDVEIADYLPNPALLSAAGGAVEEALASDLLRSVCPVTGQPDWASVQVRYRGPRIDRAGLLAYIVSFREHPDFHEHCVERMFVDILARCRPERLSVYARYTRRGGLDINPFRTNWEQGAPPNARTPRQ